MIRILKFILVLLLLVGCQNEVIESADDNRPNPDGSVGFRLQIENSHINSGKTKGTPQSGLEKYDSVCVNAFSHTSDYEATVGNDVNFFQKVKLEQEAPNWKYTPPMFWPVDKKLSFFAYASDIPFSDAGILFLPSSGVPDSIVYKVPSEVTKQPDLLVSTKYNQPKTDNVFLTMKHALACVSFCGIAPEGETYVKSITLRNVYGQGSLALNDSAMIWNVNKNSKNLTVFEAGINEEQELGKDPLPDNNYLMTADGFLMMIPQALTNAAIDVLYWNKKDDKENKVITYTLPIDDPSYATWRPGQRYIYKFGSQSKEDITVVYYEKYANNEYGLYRYDKGNLQNSLDDTEEIIEAGYGVLTKDSVGLVVPIRLTTHSSSPVSTGTVVKVKDINSFLYPVSQSGNNTFALSASSIPVDVYFNNSDKSCGMIVPHFAKGVYTVKTAMKTHAIRTPQQMRNITASDVSSGRMFHTYTQELDLDFSKTAIGGEDLTTSVVNREFNDLFEGKGKRIENVRINTGNTGNGALFQSNSGRINEVVLMNSSITSSGNTGGIAAINQSNGVIFLPRIIGENNSDKKFEIQGTSGYVGAIAGFNSGHIIGNTTIEKATELPIAEVSGWVLIKGVSAGTGGITGENQGTITTCLVNGVHVKDNKVEIAKITIEGGHYVGGIVGVNRKTVDGNFSRPDGEIRAEPDLAGIVSISGTNWVGGIAGENSGVLNQVNLRLGRGDVTNAMTITGVESVGGIVGYNNGGTLKADGNSNSFISVRGNVIITGIKNVGGIVGNNGSGDISNCFVYNFYSQLGTLVHYAPKITGETNVGGIVGYAGTGIIKQCAVFSTVSAENGVGEDVRNAVAEIKATVSSAGGIVGHGFTGFSITQSFVLGNVKVDGKANSGGFVGENDAKAKITFVHIGNSGTEVSDIYAGLFDKVKLPVRDVRMKTNGDAMTKASGRPIIEGTIYVGGICGVNWGTVDGVSIKDNIKIGTSSSNFVGGITGGNGLNATISNCKTYNPADGKTFVEIIGDTQVGGIVGLNNGSVETCQLGLPDLNSSHLITIQGKSALGGIAGSNGGLEGHGGTGNANTIVKNCNVYGKVLIEAVFGGIEQKYRIGGIIGENGPTNTVVGCNVIGYASTDESVDSYDIRLKGAGSVGGIAGANYGHIYGTSSSYCTVTHTAVVASNMYAGGLVGVLKSNRDSLYEASLYYCDVSRGVLVHYNNNAAGAFVGQMEGVGATGIADPTLFGTAPGGPNNRIYIGTTNPVRIDGNNSIVKIPPSLALLPEVPPSPHDSDKTGNLWANYQKFNYLHYTTYP